MWSFKCQAKHHQVENLLWFGQDNQITTLVLISFLKFQVKFFGWNSKATLEQNTVIYKSGICKAKTT